MSFGVLKKIPYFIFSEALAENLGNMSIQG